jgi:hypothetical protein
MQGRRSSAGRQGAERLGDERRPHAAWSKDRRRVRGDRVRRGGSRALQERMRFSIGRAARREGIEK